MRSIRCLIKCFSAFFTNQRKHKRRIVTVYFVITFLGIYLVLGQLKQRWRMLDTWTMSNTRTFASESSFSWNSVLDTLENTHTLKGDILPLRKVYTQSKNTREKLKVIVLLHSHNDPGYKKTYDVYYHTKTKRVLSLAVEKLMKYKDLTFIWTDTCSLDRWWQEQNKQTKANLKHLVETGRFEISLGAWVSADECVTHYFSYIDQLIEGYFWIRQHFNVFPNISFNMDQFGTSSSVHYIRKIVGIKHSVYNHIHKGTKVFFRKNKLLEFNLRQSLVDNMDSFVHVEPFDDLGFRGSCGPGYKICARLNLRNTTLSFENSSKQEIKRCEIFAEQLVTQLRLKSDMYLHNVVFLPVGDDFVYITAKEWDNEYTNLKKLMDYINRSKQYNIHMQFGTLSQYFGELEKYSEGASVQFPKVSGDLFPYTRGPKYWSGYFTTRQFIKRLGRELQESVRAAEILMAFMSPVSVRSANRLNTSNSFISKLIHARRELGLFQHHDAITGTSETSVIKDYKQRLSLANIESQDVMAYLIKSVLEGKCKSDITKEENSLDTTVCNISVLPKSFRGNAETLTKHMVSQFEENETQLVLFNSFTQSRNELVSFTVKHDPNFLIVNKNGENVYYDVQNVSNGFMISFIANLSPISLSLYNLVRTNQYKDFKSDVRLKVAQDNENLECDNTDLSVKFSVTDGSPSIICSKKEFTCRRFETEIIHYKTASDAYTFSNSNLHTKITKIKRVQKLSGDTYCSVEFEYEFIRIQFLLQKSKGINSQRLQIDIYDDLSGRNFLGEFAVRVKTDIKNKNEFYTDSNGMQLKKRLFRSNMSFGGNIYPMTSMAVIEDNENRLNIYSTQPHGIVSTKPGWIDITIDRVVVAKSDTTVTEFRENTFDNVATCTHLFVKFESVHKSMTNHRLSENIAPTLDSVLTDDLIQHPVYVFHALTKFKLKHREFVHTNHPVPNELVIANLKTLFGIDLEHKGTSLTLFRRFVSDESLRKKPIAFNPDSLFKNNGSTVRFIFSNEKISNNSYIFMPFDLRTFVIQ